MASIGLRPEQLLGAGSEKESDLRDWLRVNGGPQVETFRYPSDGWEIEAILVLPVDRPGGMPLPTLLYLHGGPESRNSPTLKDLASARGESAALFLASHGYAVLLPNFRGSSGYGQPFMDELGDYQLMKKPFRDAMAGVDALIGQGIADPERLGAYGSSYGAQLAAWAIAHTPRFRASVLSVGRYDPLVLDRCSGRAFHSLKENRQGESATMDMWLRPEVYADLSPMHHVRSVRTPAMIVETGAERKDLQARMLFNALQALGVDSHWICYPSALHNGRWDDASQCDYMARMLAWWNHHLSDIPLPPQFGEKAVVFGETGEREATESGQGLTRGQERWNRRGGTGTGATDDGCR